MDTSRGSIQIPDFLARYIDFIVDIVIVNTFFVVRKKI